MICTSGPGCANGICSHLVAFQIDVMVNVVWLYSLRTLLTVLAVDASTQYELWTHDTCIRLYGTDNYIHGTCIRIYDTDE